MVSAAQNTLPEYVQPEGFFHQVVIDPAGFQRRPVVQAV